MNAFETITLAPIDRRLIDVSLMTADEIAWLDGYHARVAETIGPLVDKDTAILAAGCDPPAFLNIPSSRGRTDTQSQRSAERSADRPAPLRLIVLLMAMSAIGPVSLNILVPATPGLAVLFDTKVETVQLTLSLYLFGLAVSQLLLGPLSDRFGRKPVLLIGLFDHRRREPRRDLFAHRSRC